MRRVAILSTGVLFATTQAFAQTVALSLTTGEDEALEARLAAASLSVSLQGSDDAQPQDFVAAARADYRRILTGLYGAGYYGGSVTILVDGREAAGIAALDAPDQIGSISITVDPGPQFTFGTAAITPVAEGTELPDAFTSGAVAGSAVIEATARAGVTGWRAEGHPLAAVAGQQITANHPAQVLDATITLDPGPQLTFGTVTITGNEAVRTERVREIAGIPGGVFDPNELDRAVARLRRTGTFRSVAIIEADAADGTTLPLEVQVVEETPRRIGFGAEYGTIEGLSVSAFWLHRNLLGGAERFRLEGEVTGIDGQTGGVDYRLGATFGRPATFRPDVDLLANVTLERQDEPNYLLDQLSADIGLTQYRTDRLTYGAAIGFITAREETPQRTRDYTLLTLPLSGTYDQRDVPLDPTTGFYIDLEATPFVGLEGGANGARLFADLRAYRSVAQDRLTFAARLQLGSVTGASLDDAPADMLFFSGGGGTVRGQAYQSLGITRFADFGDGPIEVTTGGASFAAAQLEARYDVTDSIGVVGFYDVGLVGADPLFDADDAWHAGAGLGVRYQTGIGPIRLDIATPASGDNVGERVEFYIGIGQSF